MGWIESHTNAKDVVKNPLSDDPPWAVGLSIAAVVAWELAHRFPLTMLAVGFVSVLGLATGIVIIFLMVDGR